MGEEKPKFASAEEYRQATKEIRPEVLFNVIFHNNLLAEIRRLGKEEEYQKIIQNKDENVLAISQKMEEFFKREIPDYEKVEKACTEAANTAVSNLMKAKEDIACEEREAQITFPQKLVYVALLILSPLLLLTSIVSAAYLIYQTKNYWIILPILTALMGWHFLLALIRFRRLIIDFIRGETDSI